MEYVFDLLFGVLGWAYDFMAEYAELWAPILFGALFWDLWLKYVQTYYIAHMKWVMLEIRLPKEIYKPPQAMEFVLAMLDQGGGGSFYERYWEGMVPTWFSLEMASIEGRIRFFIRCTPFYKDAVESRLYSQYPDIEIVESPDYTDFYIPPKGHDVSLFGSEVILTKSDALPIKTYVDYGLDKTFLDEKQRFDPMTPMLEFMGSMGKGEQVWIQILVQGHKKRYKKKDGSLGDWRDEARDQIKKIREEGIDKEDEDEKGKPSTTRGQNERIAAIERNMGKIGLDVGIRQVYIADKFRASNLPGLSGMFKVFNSPELNGFKTTNSTGFSKPWEEVDRWLGTHRLGVVRKAFIDAFKRRSYFYPPYKRQSFVLTTEELATIFRPPSGVAETPTLPRMVSKKAEPPVNLPL